MGKTEWNEALVLMDTASKLVGQAQDILARDNFPDTWKEPLQDIKWELQDYMSDFRVGFLEDE